jgi:hypothetical protein
LESVFICTFGPKETDADAPDIACLAARAAIAWGETMARTPFEMPPGYRSMCKIQRGVLAGAAARLGAAAKVAARVEPATSNTVASLLTTSTSLCRESSAT